MSIVLTYFFTIKCAFLDLCVWSAAVESVCWVGYEINKGIRASLIGGCRIPLPGLFFRVSPVWCLCHVVLRGKVI